MLIGHTGPRPRFLVVTGVKRPCRALPTLGVLLLGVLLWGLGLVPPTVALIAVGHPAAAGGHLTRASPNVDRAVVDAGPPPWG